eukprot:TRINITY_DN10591_c0_g1_i1.p1 TRINITY_DN10591_c0_g1~~TRINITY_DN10591_c0_g1_i1.p1  ORF type:complete len:236 (-),score=18.87 TRINITY_DN10591_c0_g1_i1:25-732(-)
MLGKAKDLFYNSGVFHDKGNGSTAVIAYCVGLTAGLGLAVALLSHSFWNLGAYLFFLGFFHFSEYFMVALFNPTMLSTNSFLVNHSKEYLIATGASFVEYFVERFFFPNFKGFWPIVWLGIIVAVIGSSIRLVGMYTAAQNFTHEVQTKKRDEHTLTTDGIYKYIRHPGYMGWFYFSIATQVLLVNPICAAGFAWKSWEFFSDRIYHEEIGLIEFFGEEYEEYRKRTPTYIPLIK